jgi:diguanylate cyclase (GGDEF)-like protein
VALLLLVVVAVLAGALVLRATVHRRAAERRARSLTLLTSAVPGAMLMFDRRLRHVLAGGRNLDALGLDADTVSGRTLREMFPQAIHPILEPAYRAALEGDESTLELAFENRDFVVVVTPVSDGDRVPFGIAAAYDVTERRRREHRLTQLASRDSLTGIWNRRRLLEELEWLHRGAVTGGAGAGSLVFLDLNGFKQVNDTLGHEAGDDLLRRVAQAVQGCVRRADLVARIGGDEFAVLLPGATPLEAEHVAGMVRAAIEAVWPVGLRGGVSAGVTAIGRPGLAAEDILAGADRRMYASKRAERLRRVS